MKYRDHEDHGRQRLLVLSHGSIFTPGIAEEESNRFCNGESGTGC